MIDSARTAMVTCLCAVVTIGCLSEVDTEGLPSADDYRSWTQLAVTGDAPPHGDDLRLIYVNDAALSYAGAGAYPLGSVVVKEIYDDEQGDDLSYVAFMRRIDSEPDGGDLEGEIEGQLGGWLFTMADDAGADETQGLTCWDSCHVQAPYHGAWFDYGALLEPQP